MDKISIIETVSKLFIAVDEKDWDIVNSIFDVTVLLDYTSMVGGAPTNLTSNQIIESWQGVLPGFDRTHHQLGNFQVDIDSNCIKVFCYGTATHFLKNDSNNNIWTVVGSYNFELQEKDSIIKITKMKFNLKYIDGNGDLARIAQERMKK